MTTYRVGNHHGVTIVREGDGHRCDLDGHDCARGHLVGVMLTAEDAALVVEALNGTPASQAAARCAKCGNALAACQDCGKPAQCGEPWCVDCQPEEGWLTSETVSAATVADVMAIVDAPYQPGIDVRLEGADSCHDDYADWWQEHTDDDGELLVSLPEPVATLAAHVMALQERIDKLADPTTAELDPRGWDTRCACAYDHPDAVCMVHKAVS